jgi:hypothetical protein
VHRLHHTPSSGFLFSGARDTTVRQWRVPVAALSAVEHSTPSGDGDGDGDAAAADLAAPVQVFRGHDLVVTGLATSAGAGHAVQHVSSRVSFQITFESDYLCCFRLRRFALARHRLARLQRVLLGRADRRQDGGRQYQSKHGHGAQVGAGRGQLGAADERGFENEDMVEVREC